jgi:hypothetical protein
VRGVACVMLFNLHLYVMIEQIIFYLSGLGFDLRNNNGIKI